MPRWIMIQQPLSSVRVPLPLIPLVESEALQSLRRAPVWNGADLVYPGSKNDRFEHALGSLERAQAMLAALRNNVPEITEILAPEDELRYLAAALVHDIAFAASPLLDLIAEALDEVLIPRTGREIILQTLGEPLKAMGLDPLTLANLVYPLPDSLPSTDAYENRRETATLLADCLFAPLGCVQADVHPRSAFHAGLASLAELPGILYPSVVTTDSYDRLTVLDFAAPLTRLWSENIAALRRTLYHHPCVRAGRAMIKKAIDALLMEPEDVLRALSGKTPDDCKTWIATQGNVVADALVRGTRVGERGLYRTVLSLRPGEQAFLELAAHPGSAEIELAEFLGLEQDEIILETPRRFSDPQGHLPSGWCPVIHDAMIPWQFCSSSPDVGLARSLARPTSEGDNTALLASRSSDVGPPTEVNSYGFSTPVDVLVTPAKADRVLRQHTPESIIRHIQSHAVPA
ncbi:MAG: hypothetical protein HYT87_12695 [Nitrospirae bacterium]|nr:hypothetical protein [Nitrospirota bacterium]